MGQPHILDGKDLQEAETLIEGGEVQDGANVMQKLFPHVDKSTIQRNLCEIGLNGWVHWEKPYLSDKYIK